MIACPNNVYPLIPHFYIVKLGYAGVNMFFLFLIQNIDCGYSLEPPQRGSSYMYPQSMISAKLLKISKKNLLKIFNSYNLGKVCILHGHVLYWYAILKTKSRDVLLLLLDERHHVKTLHQTNRPMYSNLN